MNLFLLGGTLWVGYLLGRTRPLASFDHMAWCKGISGISPTWHPFAWGVVWLSLHPRKAWRSFRRRNDPRRAAAPTLVRRANER